MYPNMLVPVFGGVWGLGFREQTLKKRTDRHSLAVSIYIYRRFIFIFIFCYIHGMVCGAQPAMAAVFVPCRAASAQMAWGTMGHEKEGLL